MPTSKHDLDKACEYATGLYTERLGGIEAVTTDASGAAVTIRWEKGVTERYSTDKFIEKMKACAVRLGDKVEF